MTSPLQVSRPVILRFLGNPASIAPSTDALGEAIGHRLHGGEIIAVTGQLGAGKTVLTKGIASGLGISPIR